MPKEREIDELTLNAWPPLETPFFDGWDLLVLATLTHWVTPAHTVPDARVCLLALGAQRHRR